MDKVEVEKEYIARLYVCLSYLYAVSENNEIKNKDEFRKKHLKYLNKVNQIKLKNFI